ncbi:hypothetical protein APY04_1604 [Hyphomicrobium sulfonivorans]|uniref:Uncharacterized protein n=1 Tax=Hyphomicrobium sulfonivorans TaxID=121290 RepID=A0A109BHZ5_HYPSL|nr:hypothetical protein APY04_1604 [Hyphomicrobium sulfonivorans]
MNNVFAPPGSAAESGVVFFCAGDSSSESRPPVYFELALAAGCAERSRQR